MLNWVVFPYPTDENNLKALGQLTFHHQHPGLFHQGLDFYMASIAVVNIFGDKCLPAAPLFQF